MQRFDSRKLRFIRWPGFGVVVSALCSCILPPVGIDESVESSASVSAGRTLGREELALVSTLKRGKDYATGGRADLAEVEFRKAIRLRPTLSSAWSDLGYVLMQQERIEEAERMFRRAIVLAPENVVALDNLGRSLYRQGKGDEAAEELEKVIGLVTTLSPEELKRASGQDFSLSDIASVRRNLAITYFGNGRYDESVCQSLAALAIAADATQIGQHVRLLLALGKIDSAVAMLRDILSNSNAGTPGKLFFDYAIALYESNDIVGAKDALSRVLLASSIEQNEKIMSRLLKVIIARKAGNVAEAKDTYELAIEDEPQLCKYAEINPDRYWPPKVVQDLESFLTEVCSAEDIGSRTSGRDQARS